MGKEYFLISQQCYKDEHIKGYTKAVFSIREKKKSINAFQDKPFRTERQREMFKYYGSVYVANQKSPRLV